MTIRATVLAQMNDRSREIDAFLFLWDTLPGFQTMTAIQRIHCLRALGL